MTVMESRDGFFTRVKQEVEMQYQLSQGIKPIMVSHSYGAQVSIAFLDWVERQNPGWVDKHLKGYVNLAGPMLGLPKSLSPLLSGEHVNQGHDAHGLACLRTACRHPLWLLLTEEATGTSASIARPMLFQDVQQHLCWWACCCAAPLSCASAGLHLIQLDFQRRAVSS